MAEVFTAKRVETIKAGTSRQELPDARMPGLYLIIQPSGAKSWAVRYRHNGSPRKCTLGSWPRIDLAQARAFAGKALRAAAEGRDPAKEKSQARDGMDDSVQTLAARFIETHCKRNNRPRTAQETERLFNLHILPKWRGRRVQDITKREVIAVLDHAIARGSPVAANRALTAMHTMFAWCVSRGIIETNPCTGIRRPTVEHSRDRILTDGELRKLWKATGKVGHPFGPLVKLLLLTGQRREEVAAMEWAEVDLDSRVWTLPSARAKNYEPHEIPLSDAAIAVLDGLDITGGRFVLTTTGEKSSNNYSKNKRRLDALLPTDMPSWRLHDLRRTAASGMARLGVNLPVIEKVLNHTSGTFGGIVGVYQRHSFADEKRQALDAWGKFVIDLVGGKPISNVVPLGQRHA